MTAALHAALAFEGATAPNPPVGCVLLDQLGNIIAVAAHQKAGQLHAEALAIKIARDAGLADRIHTVVVTLEPCNHHGRTPPCSEAILSTSAKAVVIGMADPNPSVEGGGAKHLAEAGLNISLFDAEQHPALAQSLKRLIGPFAKRTTLGLPWVTVKQAINREGNMLPPVGLKTFTTQSSLKLAHTLRRRADAIITGSGTILADNTHFTVRHVQDFADKHRKLVLFDRRRRISNDYLETAVRRGFETIFATELETTLRTLASNGALEVLVEAGPQLTSTVLSSSFWDEHVLITQAQSLKGEDSITIRNNTRHLLGHAKEDKHVFGHH